MVILLSCFISYFQLNPQKEKLESGSKSLKMSDFCKFCNTSMERGFNIAYQDEFFVAFEDRSPASLHHYLVVPKQHIESVRSLKQSDVGLVKTMEEIGHAVMSKLGIPSSLRVMGFHIPPFNSVYHLHLHVQALPYRSSRYAAKYPVSSGFGGYSKGLSWFVEVNQVIQILERGRRVGIWPC